MQPLTSFYKYVQKLCLNTCDAKCVGKYNLRDPHYSAIHTCTHMFDTQKHKCIHLYEHMHTLEEQRQCVQLYIDIYTYIVLLRPLIRWLESQKQQYQIENCHFLCTPYTYCVYVIVMTLSAELITVLDHQ